ncbi:hypothetical protein [Antribacter gilvus]|uniref:DUF7937 domain-containing protein n=1 Tax=Antribacter gilvus TaxID=2304675 RepID=UPI000F7B99E6|nr:hypothetical protein [Antribacter gilvus]
MTDHHAAPGSGPATNPPTGRPGRDQGTDPAHAQTVRLDPLPAGVVPADPEVQSPDGAPAATGDTPQPSTGAAAVVSGRAALFANVPVADYVRDVVATIALLVALALPWTVADRGADRVEVVLATAVSLLSLALPYLARVGALPATWTVHSTRRARAWAAVPLAVVAAVHLVRDVAGATGVGTGLGLALAGAAIAAMPRAAELGPVDVDGAVTRRWRHGLLGGGVLLAVGAVLTLVIFYVGDSQPEVPALLAPLALIQILGIGWLLVWGTVRGEEASRLVLVAVGVVLAVLYIFSSGNAVPGMESTHWVRFGFVLLPAIAAVASSPVVGRGTVTRPETGRSADVWVAAAVRAFDVIVLLAAVLVASAVVVLVANGFDVVPVLRLVLGLIMGVLAVLARRSLARDASTGHVPAVGAACVIGVLGLVIVIATTGAGDQVDLADLLLGFGLPAVAAYSLMVPKAVREHFSTAGIGGDAGVDRTQAYEWRPRTDRSPEPVSLPSTPVNPAPETRRPPEPRRVTSSTRPATPGRGIPGGDPAIIGNSAPGSGAQPVGRPAAPRGAQQPGVQQPGSQPGPRQPAAHPAAQPGAPTGAQPTGAQPAGAQPAGAQPAVRPGAEHQPTQAMPAVSSATPAVSPTAPAVRPAVRPTRSSSGADATQVIGAARGDSTQVMSPVAVPPRWSAEQAIDPATPLADLARIVQEAPHLRPQVAANPSTYPALLDWLGALGDPAVDAALRTRR